MTFYYAATDENGVLCIDQMGDSVDVWTAEHVAKSATLFPDTIYFEVEPPPAPLTFEQSIERMRALFDDDFGDDYNAIVQIAAILRQTEVSRNQ